MDRLLEPGNVVEKWRSRRSYSREKGALKMINIGLVRAGFNCMSLVTPKNKQTYSDQTEQKQ